MKRKHIAMGLFWLLLGCDEGGGADGVARDGTIDGECGLAVLELSGARNGTVQVGDGGLIGGVCTYGVLGDDTELSMTCIFHAPSGPDLVSGVQFTFHIKRFAFGSRSWVIDVHGDDPDFGEPDNFSHVRYSDLELQGEVSGDAFITGVHEEAGCVVDLVVSDEGRVAGTIDCVNLEGRDDALLDLSGSFCADQLLAQ